MAKVPDIIASRLPALPKDRPVYWSAFESACTEIDPAYGESWYGDLFRSAALDLNWLAHLLVINSHKEAEGSRKLWELCGRICDPARREKVRLHAIDESRHSSFYISMLELAFPNAVPAEHFDALRSISPGFKSTDQPALGLASSDAEVLDEIIQMNIGEVRTLINQLLMRPVLDVIAPHNNQKRLLSLIDALANDELAHVAYTADLIEEMSNVGDIRAIMRARMQEFSEITCREVGVRDGELPTFS